MVKPVTARRRNRVLQQQQQSQMHQQQQVSRQRDDELTLHDEADVMSFRSAATNRFLMNQELMESLLERWVPLRSIVKPTPFPVDSGKSELEDEEIYFGNLELMKKKLKLIETDIDEVNVKIDNKLSFNEINYLNEQITELSNNFKNPSISNIENFNKIQQSYSKKFNKSFKDDRFKIRSIKKLNIDLSKAPDDYWLQLKKAKEEAHQKRQQELLQQQLQSNNNIHMQQNNEYNDNFQIPPSNSHDLNYDANAFGEDMNMIDDVGFGLQAGLDDQDFLSGIDDSIM